MKKKAYLVKGSGTFPLDMLRYDEAWPARGEDVDEMGRSCERVVELLSTAKPTVARWESFGWSVWEQAKGFGRFERLENPQA